MILINRTYSEVTPESAEDGEISDSGFISENEAVTFRELVSLMKEHVFPSCSRGNGSIYEWFSTEATVDIWDGSSREESLHYSRDNPGKNAKYWRLAAIAAGHVSCKGV